MSSTSPKLEMVSHKVLHLDKFGFIFMLPQENVIRTYVYTLCWWCSALFSLQIKSTLMLKSFVIEFKRSQSRFISRGDKPFFMVVPLWNKVSVVWAGQTTAHFKALLKTNLYSFFFFRSIWKEYYNLFCASLSHGGNCNLVF